MKKKFVVLVSLVLLAILASLFIFNWNFISNNNSHQIAKSTSSSSRYSMSSQSVASSPSLNSSSTEDSGRAETSSSVQSAEQTEVEDWSADSEETSARQVLLSVTSQAQENKIYCAPTSVSMILSARGLAVNQHQLAKEMGTYEPFGTHNRDAIRVLNRHLFGYENPAPNQAGYRLQRVTNVDEALPLFEERLKKNIADGYPMYYTIDVSKVYPGKSGEHNVVGVGYQLAADGRSIDYLYYLDPAYYYYTDPPGPLKTISTRKLLTAMLTCSEADYAW